MCFAEENHGARSGRLIGSTQYPSSPVLFSVDSTAKHPSNAKFTVHGRRAGEILAFRDGYEMGYIKGAIERRIGSLHELAPE